MTTVPLDELPQFVRNALTALRLRWNKDRAVILALEGDLGAGKTTFVQQLARQLGVAEPLMSPTYVLMKKYPLPDGLTWFGEKRRFKVLVHIDAYRLENPEQFAHLWPQEFLNDPTVLVVVEWPDKLGALLPTPDMTLRFKDGTFENARDITMEE